MARPNRDVEIIEVLAPDDPSLWQPAAWRQPRPDDSDAAEPTVRGRRWLPWVLVGTVAAVALVGGAVALFGDGDDPAPEPVVAEGKYLLDNGSVRSYSADIVAPADGAGRFIVMASSVDEEAWMSVEITRAGDPPVFRDAYVDDDRGLSFVRAADDPQRVAVVVHHDDDWNVVLRTGGVPDPVVEAMARGMSFQGDATEPVLSWSSPGDEWTGLSSGLTRDEVLFGKVSTRMTYLDEHADLVTLRVADGDLATMLRVYELLGTRPPDTADGRSVVTLADTGETVVLWEQDGHVLSLTATAARPELVALSKEVRPATEDEWRTRLIFLRPDYRVGDFVTVASGDGWVAGVQRAERGGADKFLWWFSVPGEDFRSVSLPVRFDPATMPFADRVVVGGTTYVFVSMPVSTGVGSGTVVVGDASPVELTLRRAFLDVDAVFAVYRTDAAGEVRVFTPGDQPVVDAAPDVAPEVTLGD